MYLAEESPEGSGCELIVPIPSNTFSTRRPTAQKAFLLASGASHDQWKLSYQTMKLHI